MRNLDEVQAQFSTLIQCQNVTSLEIEPSPLRIFSLAGSESAESEFILSLFTEVPAQIFCKVILKDANGADLSEQGFTFVSQTTNEKSGSALLEKSYSTIL